jgi:hypothetical protein
VTMTLNHVKSEARVHENDHVLATMGNSRTISIDRLGQILRPAAQTRFLRHLQTRADFRMRIFRLNIIAFPFFAIQYIGRIVRV